MTLPSHQCLTDDICRHTASGYIFSVRELVLIFTRNFQGSFFLCFGTFSWIESIILILKYHNFSTLDSTSLLKTSRPLDRQFFMLQAKEDKCFFLSTNRLLNPCLHNSSTCPVTKILSGLLLSVTLSLFTLTQLSYFLSPGQVIVHVHCLWHTRQEQCGCRAGGLKLNTENVRTRGVGPLVLLLFRTTFSHCYGHLSLG